MTKIQDEINKKITECVRDTAGIDVTNADAAAQLAPEEKAQFIEVVMTCVMRELGKITKQQFEQWFEGEIKEAMAHAQGVGERLIRFGSKVTDAAVLFEDLAIAADALQRISQRIDDDEILSQRKTLIRFLLVTALESWKSNVTYSSLKPLLFATELAQSAIDRDLNWCTAVLALTVEEQFLKKTCKSLGIAMEWGDDYSVLVKKLLDHMKRSGIRVSREIFLAEGHRTLRNKTLHENWTPSADEVDDIVAHVTKMVSYLQSQVQGSDKKPE
jgi:hypothetical protein